MIFQSKISSKASPKAIYKLINDRKKYVGCCCLPEKILDIKLNELSSISGYRYTYWTEDELEDRGIYVTKITI